MQTIFLAPRFIDTPCGLMAIDPTNKVIEKFRELGIKVIPSHMASEGLITTLTISSTKVRSYKSDMSDRSCVSIGLKPSSTYQPCQLVNNVFPHPSASPPTPVFFFAMIPDPRSASWASQEAETQTSTPVSKPICTLMMCTGGRIA